jgi:hypothetical protein
MITWALETFIAGVQERGRIGRDDVRLLQRDILPNGVENRDEADMLIALDRAIPSKDASWSAFAIQTVVDFVVWTSRPTGRIDRETAEWLVASLGCGTGPTDVALAIAFEAVRESDGADELLVAFVMRSTAGRRAAMEVGLARAA